MASSCFFQCFLVLTNPILLLHFQFNFSGVMEPSASCLPGFFMVFILLKITVLTQGRGILPHFLMKFVLGQFHTCLQGIITTYLQYSYSSFTLIISSPPRMSLSHIYASSFVLEPIAF